MKEHVTSKEWLAAAIIIVGIVLANLNANQVPNGSSLLSFYWQAFAQPDSLLYFGIFYGIIAIAIFWSIAHAWKGGIYYIRISGLG